MAVVAATIVPGVVASSAPLHEDDFETGDLSKWTSGTGMIVQQADVHAGGFAARTNTSKAWVSKKLTGATELHARIWFKVLNRSTPVWLTRFRPATGSTAKILLNTSGKLAYRNDVAGVTRTSSLVVTNGVWHELAVDITVAGASGHVRVSLDGSPVAKLDNTENLGSNPIRRFEVGNAQSGQTYTIVYDDVVLDDQPFPPAPMLEPPVNLQATAVTSSAVSLAWDAPTGGETPDAYTVYRDNVSLGSVAASTTTFEDTAVDPDTKYSYTVAATKGATRSGPATPALVTMPQFDAGTDAVVFAAGDIACVPGAAVTPTTCHHAATSDILVNGGATTVFPLGDTQYEQATAQQYAGSYAPTWGRVLSVTRPVPGNHEYRTSRAAGYFGYFGAAAGDPSKGYYSFDLGTWRVIVLNSNCDKVGGCTDTSPQGLWLANELATNTAACTLAMWHHPRWSSGSGYAPGDPRVAHFWNQLVAYGADLVLSSHEHIYERFAPQDETGGPSPTGVRQFSVGTGGRSHYGIGVIDPESEVRDNTTFGVLKLTLHSGGYDYRFVPEFGGSFTDAGSEDCH
jgi:hypothetical protein